MNNEPVAWMTENRYLITKDENLANIIKEKGEEPIIPLYTHPAKTQELLKEIQELKEKLMMEEESYILLDEELLCAKEAIKQQQVKIEVLKAKTLTGEEIEAMKARNLFLESIYRTIKAQEK
jgi:hypothetical protein